MFSEYDIIIPMIWDAEITEFERYINRLTLTVEMWQEEEMLLFLTQHQSLQGCLLPERISLDPANSQAYLCLHVREQACS